MSRSRGDWPAWKWLLVGCFAGTLSIGSLVGLFTSPILTTEWFAGLAGLALFLPILVMALSQIPGLGRPLDPTDPRTAAMLLGCVSIALAAGAVSGAIGYFVDDISGFWTGRGKKHWLPMPAFIVVSSLGAVGFGLLAGLAGRRTRGGTHRRRRR